MYNSAGGFNTLSGRAVDNLKLAVTPLMRATVFNDTVTLGGRPSIANLHRSNH